jgi:hypothetical protein
MESFTPIDSPIDSTPFDLTGIQIGLYIIPDKPVMVELSGVVMDSGGEARVVDESLMLFRDHVARVSTAVALGP